MRRAPLLAVLLVALAGCGGGDDASEPTEPAPSATSVEPGDPNEEATACLSAGEWTLDVGDLASQAAGFMQGTGAPISDVQGSGSQTIRFTADGLVAMYTDITLTATIAANGANGTATAQRVDEASGDWEWVDGDRLGISNWTWLTEETTSSATVNGVTVPGQDVAYPVYDLSEIGAITVECSDDSLVLSGESAPIVSRWSR